jgi:hypothetical protein
MYCPVNEQAPYQHHKWQGVMNMSVRATGALIAELVVASGLAGSPTMIVRSVDEAEKTVTAVWFSSGGEFQQGVFPASALDRAEAEKKPAKKK